MAYWLIKSNTKYFIEPDMSLSSKYSILIFQILIYRKAQFMKRKFILMLFLIFVFSFLTFAQEKT